MIFSTWGGVESAEMEGHQVAGLCWADSYLGVGPPTVRIAH